jgi:hypothetical protein
VVEPGQFGEKQSPFTSVGDSDKTNIFGYWEKTVLARRHALFLQRNDGVNSQDLSVLVSRVFCVSGMLLALAPPLL